MGFISVWWNPKFKFDFLTFLIKSPLYRYKKKEKEKRGKKINKDYTGDLY